MEKNNLNNIVTPLLNWYTKQSRILPWREEPTAYRVWVSEIMLQQTRVEAVKPYFERFMKELPDISSLAQAEEEQLLKLWEGLGYYNRVRNLQKAAKIVMEQYQGSLPAEYKALLTLPGIGQYTAGAIGSIAFGLPVTAVDGNVFRVITRLTANDGDITTPAVKSEITQQLQAILPQPFAGNFNQSLMELGAVICLPNGEPLCQKCPISAYCKSYAENTMMKYPVKPPKKERKKENRIIFLLVYKNQIAIQKRLEKGLLAKLWQFPQVQEEYREKLIEDTLDTWGLIPRSITKLGNAKHIFTHIEWHMTGCLVVMEHVWNKEEFVWVSAEELEKVYAIPSAFRYYLKEALKQLKE